MKCNGHTSKDDESFHAVQDAQGSVRSPGQGEDTETRSGRETDWVGKPCISFTFLTQSSQRSFRFVSMFQTNYNITIVLH